MVHIKAIDLDDLEDQLPHGSGINYEWGFDYDPGEGDIVARNAYDIMNEYGMYIGVIGFSFALEHNASDDTYTMSSVVLDNNDVKDMVLSSLDAYREQLVEAVDVYTEMDGDELTDGDVERLIDDTVVIYEILAEHGYSDEGARQVSEVYPDWTESDASLLQGYLDETIYESLKSAGVVKSVQNNVSNNSLVEKSGKQVVVKRFKATSVNSVAALSELDSPDYTFVQSDREIQDIVDTNLRGGATDIHGWDESWLDDITGVVVKIGNAEYDEIWVTESSRPYELDATYELLFTQDALHDYIRNQDRG